MELSPFKRALKSTRAGVVGSRILAEQFSGVRDRFSARKRLMGSTHRGFSLSQSVDYIDTVYTDYIAYGEVEPSVLDGARVLELGPGDNLGVAMRFVADGASEVVPLDRFATWRDPEHQATIYRELAGRMEQDQLDRLESTYRADGSIDETSGRITLVEGIAIEDAPGRLGAGNFDLIVSRAVLEHVLDLPGAFRAMDELLADDGVLVHKVDLSDHGMFTGGGHHPLTFLRLSDRTYRWMGAEQGIPNRERLQVYRDLIDGLGYDYRILISGTISHDGELVPAVAELEPGMQRACEDLVADIRPRLAPRYQGLSALDLSVTDFFLIARKASPASA